MADVKEIATRQGYGEGLKGLGALHDDIVVFDADLAGSTQTGVFAKDWLLENQTGCPSFMAKRRMESQHQLEQVGAELRKLMSWTKESKLLDN